MRADSRLTSAIVSLNMVASRKKNRGILYSRLFLPIILLVLGFSFSESAAQCVSPPSGLVSWWRGENDATDFIDNNHGALINGATFATGKVGQAFSFDGVDDGINVQKSGNLDFGANDFSIEAWINFTEDFPGPDAAGIFLNYVGLPYLWPVSLLSGKNCEAGL